MILAVRRKDAKYHIIYSLVLTPILSPSPLEQNKTLETNQLAGDEIFQTFNILRVSPQ